MIIQAASIQFQHRPGDKGANLQRIAEFAAQAASRKVQLAVFPEMASPDTGMSSACREGIETLAKEVRDAARSGSAYFTESRVPRDSLRRTPIMPARTTVVVLPQLSLGHFCPFNRKSLRPLDREA